ncbi:MAG TPA: transglutaminase-like domain-containing protein [Ilumatobacteraceae bacterium]|nr:transglutaminase-like domain-containing protein [Ilumatobacteraceae bacterium]HRB02267.1 transglutaminase-like domain-containing protein [Ilumatobacteraceae bacterium]
MDPAARFAELVNRPASETHLDTMAALIGAAFETGGGGPVDTAEAIIGQVIVGLDHLADECAPSFDSILAALFMSGRLAGNRADYGDPSNSYLHRVLDTGLGIPITLSVCAMEVGRRLDVPIEGIGLPGHFLIMCNGEYADPFHGGRRYSLDELEPAWQRITGMTGDLERRFVQPTHTRSILLRVLNNLKNILVAMDEPGPLSVLATLRGAYPELAQERAEHARWLRHWN